MIILGIADSHESHACLVRDGILLAAVAEERLTKLKTDSSYPRKAIESVIEIANINVSEIDIVAFAGSNDLPYIKMLREAAIFSVEDWVELQEKFWKPKLYNKVELNEIDRFNLFKEKAKRYLASDPYIDFVKIDPLSSRKDRAKAFNLFRSEIVEKHLGIDKEKIKFFRHEECHKSYGYFSSPYRPEKALIFTCEGGGDDSSATVSILNNYKFQEVWKSNQVNIGRLYAYTTLALGMKPNQHEYKVMGLAPYGNPKHGERALKFFNSIERNEKEIIVPGKNVPDLYFYVLENLRAERFDNIAWALQEFTETLLENWVEANIEKYKINDVIFSGGVGQNIKLIKRLMLNPKIKSIWSGPISGDGSLAIGAAWLAHAEKNHPKSIKGLTNIYLGSEYNSKEIEKAIFESKIFENYNSIEKPSSKLVASWIADGYIVGRFSDKMEFGQRALGNRSILADPRTMNSVTKINQVVKQRDFWMPFTPSVIKEKSNEVLHNPKEIYSPYMTMAFDIKEKLRLKLPAVIHPADGTVRPQMLKEEDNKKYSMLIKEFEKITGIPLILNTSFNLHGEPIVESPKDAISTFLRSDLDILLFDEIAIKRKKT